MEEEKYYSMMTKTLCWSCRNAYGGCSWSRRFVPVAGWTAERRDIRVCAGLVESYRVKECPEYEYEEPGNWEI